MQQPAIPRRGGRKPEPATEHGDEANVGTAQTAAEGNGKEGGHPTQDAKPQRYRSQTGWKGVQRCVTLLTRNELARLGSPAVQKILEGPCRSGYWPTKEESAAEKPAQRCPRWRRQQTTQPQRETDKEVKNHAS